MGTIAIGVWNGVEELDLAGPYEVLAAWASADGVDRRVVTVATRPDEIRCAHGLRLVPDTTWDEVGEVEGVGLPGAGPGPLMTSGCTGALVLAASGLLEGRPATTHWSALERLAAFDGVEVRPDARYVDSGKVVTAAGVSAGIDMALHLVARLDSVERAREVRR